MRADFDSHRDVWGPLLAAQLRAWAGAFFAPAQQLRDSGLFLPASLGEPPPLRPLVGAGRRFCVAGPALHLAEDEPPGAARLRHFDLAAEEYRSAVEPFTRPVLDEVLRVMKPWLAPGARLLDSSCGPGAEAVELAARVPEGEVVAFDLSRETVREAFRIAREAGTENAVFFQHDAERLPAAWSGCFDAAVSILSFHFYADAAAATAELHRVLAPGGLAFVAEPGSRELNELAAPLVRLANPAFAAYRSPAELRSLFAAAGFAATWWTEVLPGVGVLVASRDGAGR